MSSDKAVLYYFRGRGRSEIIRLTLVATGVQWEQVDLTTPEQIDQIKNEGKLLFGQTPLIEFQGRKIVQSSSIARFFARRGKLFGQNEDEETRIDVLYEGTRDFYSGIGGYGFVGWQDYLDNVKKLALPKYLPIFNKVLKDNGSNGHLVGSELSLADVGLFEVLLMIEDYYGAQEFEPYPELKNFYNQLKSSPNFANYLSGPQRFKKPDQDYVNEVKKALRWA